MPGPELLVLVRHAEPLVEDGVPPAAWSLTDAGRAAARRLGERLVALGLRVVVSSTERKAMETATAMADALDVTFHTGHDLHEHERPWFDDRDAFEAFLRDFFADPARHAPVERRFTAAVDAITRAHRGERIAVVAHGTVLSLHLAARYGMDGWKTWHALEMPSYAVVELRTKTLVDLVTAI